MNYGSIFDDGPYASPRMNEAYREGRNAAQVSLRRERNDERARANEAERQVYRLADEASTAQRERDEAREELAGLKRQNKIYEGMLTLVFEAQEKAGK